MLNQRGRQLPLIKLMKTLILILAIYHAYLTFDSIKNCIIAEAYKAARNQLIVLAILIIIVTIAINPNLNVLL